MPRKRKKNTGNKNYYFGEEQEQAIIKYKHSTSFEERNILYKTYLEKAFNIMADAIFGMYHAKNRKCDDDERVSIQYTAISHLVEQMVKFDPTRITKKGEPAKAYSYCQTIVRNFYKDIDKRLHKEKIQILPFEDFHEQIEQRNEYKYEIDYDEQVELQELITIVVGKLRIKIDTDTSLKKNEIIVGDAIIDILCNWNTLFLEETEVGKYGKKVSSNFTKNKILFYLKENTRLSTKEIRASMKCFKELYFMEKSGFFSDM